MRPGSTIAAGCLVLLSCLRLSQQDYLAAAVFAVLALAVLLLGLSASADRTGAWRGAADSDPALREAHRRGWRRITLLGLVISAVGAFVFPPMALVVAGLSLYAAHRMRHAGDLADLRGRAAT